MARCSAGPCSPARSDRSQASSFIIETSLQVASIGPTVCCLEHQIREQLDVENGHRTELESMIGVVGRKGREVGMPTPVADFAYASLLPIELKARKEFQPPP